MTLRLNLILIVFAFMIILLNCETNQRKSEQPSNLLQGTDTSKQTTDNAISTVKTKILFDKDQPFEIVHSSRGITKQSSAPDTSMCKGWTIAQKNLTKIIKDCKPISGHEWHYLFEVLPCIIHGQLKQNDNLFDFEINGGSWVSITNSDTSILLGNFIEQNEKYFIIKVADTE